ncbi:MAG: Flp pilus assembly protein CpaB [Planctomycetota bacterium]
MTNKLALVVAVVLGVLSILGVRFYVEKIKRTYDEKVAPVDVPVATRDLKPGDFVSKGDITIQQFPHGVIDALGGSNWAANETDKIENAKIVAPIKNGQVFQQYHFRQSKVKTPLASIGPEWRAMTIAVNPVIGLAGMLRPGDKVDIIFTAGYEDSGGAAGGAARKWKITSTLAQKVDILAVDSSTDSDASSEYTTVTIKLRPEDVNRLAACLHNGWQYHLVRMDDTAPASASVFTQWVSNEFDRVYPDIRKYEETRAKSSFNNGPR